MSVLFLLLVVISMITVLAAAVAAAAVIIIIAFASRSSASLEALVLSVCAAYTMSCPIVVSVMSGTTDTPGQILGIDDLIEEIVKCVPVQPAVPSGPFKFAIDHCFAIRGQGTILTGTALSGTAKVGDALELPELKVG